MDPERFTESSPGQLVQIPGDAYAFVPDPLPPSPDLDAETRGKLVQAAHALGRLDGLGEAAPGAHLLVGPFLRREALLSSRIEGTISTMEQLVLFEMEPEEAPSSTDTREVANYVAALQYGLQQLQEDDLSLWLIRELHSILMRNSRGTDPAPGSFRKQQNAIGQRGHTLREVRYVPPPPYELDRLLRDLGSYIASMSSDVLLAQLAMIHYQFEAIHPFMDGNGRVGRLINMLLLAKAGLLPSPVFYLSGYFDRHRDLYLELLLGVSQTGAWKPWIDFFLDAILVQAEDAIVRARRLLALQRTYHDRVRLERSSAGLVHMIDLLFEWPAITARRAEQRFDISFPTAQANISKLERLDILAEATGRRRNRIYLAPEAIRIVEATHLDDADAE